MKKSKVTEELTDKQARALDDACLSMDEVVSTRLHHYKTLDSLEEKGLIRFLGHNRPANGGRRLYMLTQRGANLHRWLCRNAA